jgi:hypothetical protein
LPDIIEFSRCIGTYLSAKFELISIVSLFFCGIDLIHSFLSNQTITSEIWNLIFPVITLSLGYIFGKGESN